MPKVIHDSEFSEFGFGFTVTDGLTHFRSGTLSPWPMLSARSRRRLYHHFWDEHHTRDVLEDEFGLSPDQARAVTDAYGAPFIPTQHLEKRFPVDVALASRGIFYFLQFKRSRCVSLGRGNLIEITKKIFSQFQLPFYRVGFSGNGDREQRVNLKKLENSLKYINSALVRYAVPAFHTLSELSEVHQNGLDAKINGRSSVMCFKASAFTLPGTGNHHISYDATGTGWRFSDEPEKAKGIQPLISEIGELASDAAPLGRTMSKLCKALDKHAREMKLPERPERMADQDLIRMFGLGTCKPREEYPGISFLQTPVLDRDVSKELANGIRKMMKSPIDGERKHPDGQPSPMEFLEDFFGADYRCRQIIGQPLMVGIENKKVEDV